MWKRRFLALVGVGETGQSARFVWGSMPLRQSRKTLHVWKENSMLAKPLAACTRLSLTVSQLFEPQVQKLPFSRTAAHIFVSPEDARAIITQCVAWMERQFNACQTPRSMYPSIFNSFTVIRTASAKNCSFRVPQPTFVFPLETPLRLSRNMLHGWKDNSMLVKPLAACTHLSSTVSQLFKAQVQKIAVFTYRSPHFCFIWRRPYHYHAICCMDRKTIQCLPNPSQHAPIYLEYFPSYTMLNSMRNSKNRYFYHIFVSPGDAPGAITLNVVWMDREFHAYKLSRCMCPSNYDPFWDTARYLWKNRHFIIPPCIRRPR